MGRYNNKRTQAAAEALKNTPSRARFSKGPPNRGRPKRKNNNNNNKNNNNSGTSKHNQRRPGNAQTTARVIDKIQTRVQQLQHPTTTTKPSAATTEQALQYIDKSKLEELQLPEDIVENITTLLENLGVKESQSSKPSNDTNNTSHEENNETDEDEEEEESDPFQDGTFDVSYDDEDDHEEEKEEEEAVQRDPGTGGGYSEYDDDFVEDDYYGTTAVRGTGDISMPYDANEAYGEGPQAHDDGDSQANTILNGNDNNNKEEEEEDDDDDMKEVRETPAFLHLTQRLSFSEPHAFRACRAIENWDIPTTTKNNNKNNSENEDAASKTNKNSNEAIALAMDWLCLHLTEDELTRGFQPNKSPPKINKSLVSKSGIPLVGSNIRAIPHPSISVAKSITSDKEWARTIRIQEKVVSFLRLGFHHAEASTACEEDDVLNNSDDKKQSSNDDSLLIRLLSMVEKDIVDSSAAVSAESLNATDLAYAAEEREQELEALKAIYDDQLEVRDAEGNNGSKQQGKYTLTITPAEELQKPARTENCKVQIFLRPGYPVVQSPLFLFTNPSLAPSLLRRVNDELIRKGQENVGMPVVFEIVTFLSESLADMQTEFIKEQRRKEFEAEQLRLRKAAGHDVVERIIDSQYEGDGKLGRRQRAKLKAAEKAFDRPEQIKKQNEEFRQRQEERIKRAQQESSRIRSTRAEQAIQRREKERIEEEAEVAARSAMSDVFNRGGSADEARAAAKKAKNESLRANGVDIPQEETEKNASSDNKESSISDGSPSMSDKAEVASTHKTSKFMERLRETSNQARKGAADATPTTTAFMDRLRQMYDKAAKEKAAKAAGIDGPTDKRKPQSEEERDDLGGYHLNEPGTDPRFSCQEDDISNIRAPRPVAVPTGEMGEVMSDIISQQKEQPWLISPEARAPTITIERDSLSPSDMKRQNEISKKLQEDLARKRELATKWAEKNPNTTPQRGSKNTGFTPQKFYSMMTARQRLPAYKMEKEVINTIHANQITVIAGDTGCGKTTQVPQLVLDDLILKGQGAATNIIVTQPRRISAIGVSERISEERCEKVGETCGYSIKLEKKMSSRTRLLLCTTGILLRRLQCDPDLASVSHIFVDEVHERDLNTDFLIIILKDLLARRKELKLVLMSATLNAEAFSSYFNGCKVVSIPGRAHPVQENRLEDILELTGYQIKEGSDFALQISDSKPPKISKSALRRLYYPKYSKETIHSLSIVDENVINYELISELLEHICLNQDEGAILVFMPGMMEITKAIEEMYKKEFFQSSKVVIYPLHSSLSTAEQTAIFEIPKEGVRKIVVSTNIAETSITIEDVVYVVDAGRVKENRRDEVNETPTLVECWVSRASAKQRRGRAGRVRPGISYHMYSSHTFDRDLQDYQLPEMLRVGIEDLVLQILILDLGDPTTFLSKALNPPSELAMSNSLKLLETLGAVECDWREKQRFASTQDTESQEEGTKTTCGDLKVSSELTALGFHLATLPVDPRVGKMMIYGSLFGCVDPALTVAASMSARSPFVSPFDQREAADEARKKFAVEGSDHLTILNAFTKWKEMRQTKGNRAVQNFLKDHFLGRLTLFQMEDLRKQFAGLLTDIGFLPKGFKLKELYTTENANSKNVGLVRAVLCAGLYPNIIVAPRTLVGSSKKSDKKVGECAFQSHRKGEVYLHPSTIAFEESKLDSRYCCYHEMVKTSKTYVRDCTTVSPFALLLFGGTLKVYQTHGICSIDGWLKFRIDAKKGTLVKYLRGQMERILLKKIVSPEEDVAGSEEGKALIQSISILFQRESEINANRPDRSGGEIVRPWTGSDEANNRNNYRASNNARRIGGRGRGGGRGGRGSGRGGRGLDRSGRGGGRRPP